MPLVAPLVVLSLLAIGLLLVVPQANAAHRGGSRLLTVHLPATTYTSDTTWTLANSPYILDGDVTVAAGATLTIEPGVVVKFNGQLRSLTVNGTLSAIGSSSSHITFTSIQDDSIGGDSGGDGPTNGAAGQWYKIGFGSSNALSEFRYVDVKYGGWGSSNTGYGAISVGSTATVTVAESTISNSQRAGIFVGTGSGGSWPGAIVKHTTLSNNGNGVSVNQGSVTISDRTDIRNNSADGVWFNLTSSFTGAASSIKDSDVHANGDRGVVMQIDSGLALARWPSGTRNTSTATPASSCTP